MLVDFQASAALWWAVIASGVYHGLNPAMGWPLAVSAALMEQKKGAMLRSLALLAFGHFLSMLVILLPLGTMLAFVKWERDIRLIAGLIVVCAGLYLFFNPRHPRFLARVPPMRLALWSFLAALAHGAGLMLVPIYLGICKAAEMDAGHQAAETLMQNDTAIALMVALAHTLAMTLAGAVIASIIYFWLGLKFLSKTWFNLDRLWGLSLIIVGALGVYFAL